MRLYSFVNYYISDIQRGIQTAHLVSEMAIDAMAVGEINTSLRNKFFDWAFNHKTIIVLNGGNSAALKEIYEELISLELRLVVSKFHEDEESMNGCLTSVGILVPYKIYEGARVLRSSLYKETGSFDGYSKTPSFLDKNLGKICTTRWFGHEKVKFQFEIQLETEKWSFTPQEYRLMEILNSASLA